MAKVLTCGACGWLIPAIEIAPDKVWHLYTTINGDSRPYHDDCAVLKACRDADRKRKRVAHTPTTVGGGRR
jgi:hypothetical protein